MFPCASLIPASNRYTLVAVTHKQNVPEVWCFSVEAHAYPGLMPRLLELFAKRNLVPVSLHSTTMQGGAAINVDIQVAGIDVALATYIANCMRQIVGVTVVLFSCK